MNVDDMLLRVTAVVVIYFLSYANGQIPTNLTGIFDGFLAKPRQFPYHALIGCVQDDESVDWICNGAIINNRFVASLASCVNSCNNFTIRVGTSVHADTNITEGVPREYLSKPGTLPIFAPGYVIGNNENDLALIETSEQIIYSHSVDQVIIPKLNESTLAPDVQVIATGFGQLHHLNPYWELQYLTLNVMPNSECLETFPDLGNTTMCAKGKEYNRMIRGSMCEEYGAPLVLARDNRTFVGIYQTSIATCDVGGPEKFVNIGSFIRWIRRAGRFSTLDSNIYYIHILH